MDTLTRVEMVDLYGYTDKGRDGGPVWMTLTRQGRDGGPV